MGAWRGGTIAAQIAEPLLAEFDNEPEIRARMAKVLVRLDDQANKAPSLMEQVLREVRYESVP